MRRILLAVTIAALATPGRAADDPAAASDPMAGWVPPKVAKEKQDRTEITALFRSMGEAAKKGDLEAAAALVDFPVLMATDDSKGQATGETWTREKWMEVMKPLYKPMPDMKVTHKPTIFVITDSLATVGDEATMTMGKKKIASRSSMLLIRTGGKWRVKSMSEGGWGDMKKEPASQPGSATEKTEKSEPGSPAEMSQPGSTEKK